MPPKSIGRKLDLSSIVAEPWFFDFEIFFDDDEFVYKSNRVLYSLNSNFFREAFKNSSERVVIKNAEIIKNKKGAMDVVTQFYLFENADMTEAILCCVINFSILIKDSELFKMCIKFMRRTLYMENFIFYNKVARAYRLQGLGDLTYFYALKYFIYIYNNGNYRFMDKEFFIDVISSDKINAENEDVIFAAVKGWILHEPERSKYCDDIVSHIRTPFLSEALKRKYIYPMRHMLKTPFIPNYSEESSRKRDTWMTCREIKNNFDRVLVTEDFLNLTPKELYMLLKCNHLNTSSETVVYEGIVRWVVFDLEVRKDYITFLMKNIRWNALPIEYITNRMWTIHDPKYLDLSQLHLTALRQRICPLEAPKSPPVPRECSNTLLVIGNHDSYNAGCIEVFDVKTRNWVVHYVFDMNLARFGAAYINGTLLIVGGKTDDDDVISEGWFFDLMSKRLSIIPAMHTARCFMTPVIVDDKLYVCGGLDSDNKQLRSVEMWDGECDSWIKLAPMKQARNGHAIVVYDGQIYVFGGFFEYKWLDSVEIYDVRTNRWIEGPTMIQSSIGCSAVVFNDKIYILGGYDGTNRINTVSVLNPLTRTWSMGVSLPKAFGFMAATEIDNKIVVSGGRDVSFYVSPEVFELDTDMKVWKRHSNQLCGRYSHNIFTVPRYYFE